MKKPNLLLLVPGFSDKVGRHGHRPSFQEKADQAQKMIEKAGFPELPKKKDNNKSESN